MGAYANNTQKKNISINQTLLYTSPQTTTNKKKQHTGNQRTQAIQPATHTQYIHTRTHICATHTQHTGLCVHSYDHVGTTK
jgi:hypothetical protein